MLNLVKKSTFLTLMGLGLRQTVLSMRLMDDDSLTVLLALVIELRRVVFFVDVRIVLPAFLSVIMWFNFCETAHNLW